MKWVSCALAALLAGISSAKAEDPASQMMLKARTAAMQHWQQDARLVQIHVGGDTRDPAQPGALTSAITIGHVLFFFYSPSTSDILEMSCTLNMDPKAKEYIRQHQPQYYETLGKLKWRVNPHTTNIRYPYTLPIPENIVDVTQALARAQSSFVDSSGSFAAELHVYQVGNGASTVPVWDIRAGRGSPVLVNASTGAVTTNCDRIPAYGGVQLHLVCH